MINELEQTLRVHQRFRTTDLDEARRSVEALLGPHRLQPAGRAAAFDISYSALHLQDTSIVCGRYGAAVRIDPGALDEYYLVGMPLAGTSVVRCGNNEIHSRVGLASVQSCGERVVTEWGQDCCKLSVKIARSALERCLADLLGRSPDRRVMFDGALDLDSPSGRSWWRMLEWLVAELGAGSMFLASEGGRRSVDRTLISALLLAQPHTFSGELLRGTRRSGPAHVRKVEEIVDADPSAPHHLAELAAAAGISARALQAGFRQHRGMTVTEFIRARRLDRARAVLLAPTARTRVTDVALDAGYAHLGRFASEYRHRYGEAPSTTLKRCLG